MYLTGNLTDIQTAQDQIYYNEIMTTANNTEKLVGDGANHYYLSELEAMTQEDVILLKIYGKDKGVIQYHIGLTNAFAICRECDNDAGVCWIKEPDASLMTGVVNVTQEPWNPDWVTND